MNVYTADTMPFKYMRDVITFRELFKLHGDNLFAFLETYKYEFEVETQVIDNNSCEVYFLDLLLTLIRTDDGHLGLGDYIEFTDRRLRKQTYIATTTMYEL